jgi:SAM-dependent methyltransferase
MLQRAATRLSHWQPEIVVHALTETLPSGPFDAVVSALAIHHLSDEDKRSLYARILDVLVPGGVFVNAEQVSGANHRLQELFEAAHLDHARRLGSSESEIAGAVQRMSYDRRSACLARGSRLRRRGMLLPLVSLCRFRRLEAASWLRLTRSISNVSWADPRGDVSRRSSATEAPHGAVLRRDFPAPVDLQSRRACALCGRRLIYERP